MRSLARLTALCFLLTLAACASSGDPPPPEADPGGSASGQNSGYLWGGATNARGQDLDVPLGEEGAGLVGPQGLQGGSDIGVGRVPSRRGTAPAATSEETPIGVTSGGEQDIGWFREMVRAGRVPPAGAVSVEGLLSEHDIPAPPVLDDPDGLLYPTVASGRTRFPSEETDRATVQIGFGTNLTEESFRRRPLNLAIVIDRSGSMSGGKIAACRDAILRLLGELRPDDRIAVVSFSSEPFLHLASRPVREGLDDVRGGIQRIEAGGSTNVLAGLRVGYEQVEAHLDRGRENRVVVLTDALPNVEATDPGSFLHRIRRGAEAGVGLSLVGIGLDYGQGLARAITWTENANAVFLSDPARVAEVFRDFDLLVTPLAHDVRLAFRPAPGWEVEAVHGATTSDEEGTACEVRIPSLFASRREGGGAIVCRLRRTDGPATAGEPLGRLHLSYREVGAPEPEHRVARPRLPDGPGSGGVRKAHLLVGWVRAVKEACRAHREGRTGEARAVLSRFAPWFRERVERLESRGLTDEVALLDRLHRTMGGTVGAGVSRTRGWTDLPR